MAEAASKLSQEFRDFLIEANQHGYGSEGGVPEATDSGGWRLTYNRGPWRYVDAWEGGSPYGGHTHVSYEVTEGSCVSIWNTSYRETYNSGALGREAMRKSLGHVLSQPDPDLPIRGPKRWEEDGLRYKLQPVRKGSTIENFDAEEFFFKGGKLVYVARFMGGLANRKAILEASNPPWLEHVNG